MTDSDSEARLRRAVESHIAEGRLLRDLSRRIAMPTPSNDPAARPMLRRYLDTLETRDLELPVWRVEFADEDRSTLLVSERSGEVLGAKNEAHARGGTMLAGLLKITPVFVLVLPGLIARALYPDVTGDNARINGIAIGHGEGQLLLAVADGMDHPMLATRAPFDLLIANILAGPLIELAPGFAASLAPGATVVLAGLLDTQADAVLAAYEAQGCSVVERGAGEWCVLVLEGRT